MLAGVMDRCWLRYSRTVPASVAPFDQPHVVRKAPNVFREAHVDQCCTIVGGSFFDEVLTGADAYILKFILHDWNDDQGLRILRPCRQAMSTKAQLLIVERLIGHPMREQKASSPTLRRSSQGCSKRQDLGFVQCLVCLDHWHS
jgi:O-methyltransferase domain